MARITPPIDTTGLFIVRQPFVVDPSVAYTVKAHRTFAEIIASKLDPLALVYTPVGLSQTHYDSDVTAGAMIITLMTQAGKTIYLPDTYIEFYPNMAVIPHSWLVAVVNLGIVADTYDTTALTMALQSSVSDFTGIESVVTISRAPTTEAITQDQYVQLQAVRKAAIKNRSTLYADNLALKVQNQALRDDKQTLYDMITQLQAEIDELKK